MPLELLRFEMLLPAFGLVVARVGGVALGVPMLSSSQIPQLVKAWFIATFSLAIFPLIAPMLPSSLTLGQMLVGMVGEFVVGIVIGLGASLLFHAAEVAGKIVSHQAGLALGEVANPVYDGSMTMLDQVWFFAVLMFFLAMRGHLAVMQILIASFEHIPPMTMVIDASLADFTAGLLQSVFETAMRLAGPGILALLLTSLVMGFLTRTMPQLNVLSVGFSVKIAAGLFIVAITITLSDELMADAILDGLEQVGLYFEYVSEHLINAG